MAMSKYGTITSLAQSPLVEGLIYAGTDDGLIQVTEDGGESWRKIDRLPGCRRDLLRQRHQGRPVRRRHGLRRGRPPQGRRLLALPLQEHRPRQKLDEHRRRPARAARRLAPGPGPREPDCCSPAPSSASSSPSTAATRWIKLTGGVPNIPFRDLAIQRRENDLVGATFGRSFYILDDYTRAAAGVRGVPVEQEAELFPFARPGGTSSGARWAGERSLAGRCLLRRPQPAFRRRVHLLPARRDYLAQEGSTRQRRRRSRRRAATRPTPAGRRCARSSWRRIRRSCSPCATPRAGSCAG